MPTYFKFYFWCTTDSDKESRRRLLLDISIEQEEANANGRLTIAMVRQLFADESDDEHDLDKEFDDGDRLLQEIREADKGVGDLKRP